MISQRPSLVVYGNCQAEFLGLLLSRSSSLTSRFDVVVASNNVEVDAALKAIEPYAGSAVLLWEQHDQRPAVSVRDAVRQQLPADCAIVRYPAVGMDAFWPFYVKDPRNQAEPGFAFGRYPAGDRLAIEVSQIGLPPEDAYRRYMDLSRERMPDVNALVARDKAVQARRDAASDVGMSDFVFGNLRSTYQFWTRGHLAICVFAELLRRLLERSSEALGTFDRQTQTELQSAYAIFAGQGEFQHPIHPLVIERLGLQFVDETTRYRWLGQSWTFEEYMRRYLAFDRSW